jgi:hypothetical protein
MQVIGTYIRTSSGSGFPHTAVVNGRNRDGLGFIPRGLPAAVGGRRSWNFSSDTERLYELSLVHDLTETSLVVVTHLPKYPEFDVNGRRNEVVSSLNDAGHVALVGFISSDPPNRLGHDERRRWVHSLLVEEGIFHGNRAHWSEASVRIDGDDRDALVRELPGGLCLATDVDEAFLAVNCRQVPLGAIELVPRPTWSQEYDEPASLAQSRLRGYFIPSPDVE